MFDHLSTYTRDFARTKAFYAAVLEPLGATLICEFETDGLSRSATEMVCAFGTEERGEFWIIESAKTFTPRHIAFRAATREAVDRFHAAAVAAGARDNGKPGLRPAYHPNYYAGFVIDPDGNNIEAVSHNGIS